MSSYCSETIKNACTACYDSVDVSYKNYDTTLHPMLHPVEAINSGWQNLSLMVGPGSKKNNFM